MKRQAKNKRLVKSRRGQTIVESCLYMVLLTFIFIACYQLFIFLSHKLLAKHASFLTARSHTVGFHEQIVRRAHEVATIPIAGRIEYPASMGNLIEQSDWEVNIGIESLMTEGTVNQYSAFYEYWPDIHINLPDGAGILKYKTNVRNYTLSNDMLFRTAIFEDGDMDLSEEVDMLNHSDYYLE
ncbi:MAG: hypothetical protein MK193_07280 [Lentisphaeria bacterium]|nr:hypothetical protein [Lentisphaeria bacterium]